ncbi:histone acetyltransferase type B catalytic subunit-like [Miscanthus floridulus]|uniref:histone acetyltransferase type B catalytic subunit-like n=1 Tax=Miscanthus floridulus TaxID=154761 RepID=UPI00345806CD
MALKQKGTDVAATDPKKRRRVGFSGTGTKLDPRITLSFPAIRASGGESGAAGPIRVVTRWLSCWAPARVNWLPPPLLPGLAGSAPPPGFFAKISEYSSGRRWSFAIHGALGHGHVVNGCCQPLSDRRGQASGVRRVQGFSTSGGSDFPSQGGKGITDLKPVLQNIFGENLVEKEEFLHTFSKECEYIRTAVTNGSAIKLDGSYESDPAVEIVRVELQGAAAFLYSRLVPLVLLLVEGSTPIDIGEHGWEMLLVVKKTTQEAVSKFELLGFAAVHNFYHYPESTRLRISQILVLPRYQGQGHGLRLLEAINYIAQSENIYDVTIEDPSDYLQYVRSSIDCLRLLTFDPIKPALSAIVSSLKETNLSKRTHSLRMVPPAELMETVRQKLKINKKQFLRCWEILTFLSLDSQDHKSMDNFGACIYDRIKGEILGSASGTNGKRLLQMPSSSNEESFAVYWIQESGDADDQTVEQQPEDLKTQEQQLNELVDNQMEEIIGVAKNVTSRGKDKLVELVAQ